ncbi:hypothetical protein B9Z55_025742 [Caenorhabditis nigoni]|nr:hypothetical protein B9Z55_025742 [Caenorhabditis nigoni]
MTVSPSPAISHGDANLVDGAVEALTAASSESPDVLTALKTLGPKAATLFKSFMPIGRMAFQTLNSTV